MAWPYCEFSMVWSHEYRFPHTPNQTVLSTQTYLLPYSYKCRPVVSVRFGGEVGVVTISPSHTSTSAVISISPTRVTTSSATESCAVPVVMSLQVFGTVYSAPFPVYSVGSPISATIGLPLP